MLITPLFRTFFRNIRTMNGSITYYEIPKKDLKKDKYKDCLHAAHCMIYSINNAELPLEDKCDAKANISMQMRFDGLIGFPGGLVDEGETPVEAVAREIEEEMGLGKEKLKISPNDYLVSHYSSVNNIVLHFFVKEVDPDLFSEIESISLKSDDYGSEVMGIMRVPLYTMSDGFRGFPAFLTNSFVGNSKEQLIYALIAKGIMTETEINQALKDKKKVLVV